VFFNSHMIIDGERIEFIDCHEWFVFGGCNESGKKNDWIFHNAAIDYIIRYYEESLPHLDSWHVWTDNSPGQVSLEIYSAVLWLHFHMMIELLK